MTTHNDTHRIERDSLGEIRVPATAYYGAQTMRAVRNFPISGLRLPRAFIRAQGIIKYAAAKANGSLHLLDEAIARVIMQAAEEIIAGQWDDQFVVDVYQAGAGTSQNMNANEVIANRALELIGYEHARYDVIHPNDHVNMAQSTNDTIHVAMNIASALSVSTDLLPSLNTLSASLHQKADQFQSIVKSGRTHLQDAVPIRLGQEFGGYAAAIDHRIAAIELAAQQLLAIGMGGTAVGTGLNAHAKFGQAAVDAIGELTGLAFRLPDNLFAFVQNVEEVADLAQTVQTLACTLTKLANDIRLLSSGPRTGIGEIQLSPVQPGSSIMPGKVNPVMAEMLNMVCYQVFGHTTTVVSACQASQLELNVMMPVIGYNILQSIHILQNAVHAFTQHCIDSITADSDRCHALLMQNTAIVTSLNPIIGYDKAAEVAKAAYREGKTVRDVVTERQLLTEEQLNRYLDPSLLT